jgi:hypothetical protein
MGITASQAGATTPPVRGNGHLQHTPPLLVGIQTRRSKRVRLWHRQETILRHRANIATWGTQAHLSPLVATPDIP